MDFKKINRAGLALFFFLFINVFAFFIILQEVEDHSVKTTLIIYNLFSSLFPFLFNFHSKTTHHFHISSSHVENRLDTARDNKLDLFSLSRGDTLYAVMVYFLKDSTLFTCRVIKVEVDNIITRNGLRDYKLRDTVTGDMFLVAEEKLEKYFYSNILCALKRRLKRINQEISFIEGVKRKIEVNIEEGGRKT